MKKRITALFLCFVLSFCLASPALAASPSPETAFPAASYLIADYLGFIDDLGGGSINVVYDISAKYTIEKLGASKIEVQHKENGTWHFDAAVFSTPYNTLVESNTPSVLSYYSFSGLEPGVEYRAVIRFYAKNGSIEESRVYTTSSVILSPG